MKRFIAGLALTGLVACGGDDGPTQPNLPPGSGVLEITDLTIGTGETAANGSLVTVHYIGTFTNGQKFDSSYDRGQPLPPFRLGTGQVIPGFEQGIVGMRVGGKRRISIPPQLAYGSAGNPPRIPGNATLIFEVELLAVTQ